MNGVVPITTERFRRKENALQFIVRHLDAGCILARVQLGLDREPGACADGADELDYSLAICEATAPGFGPTTMSRLDVATRARYLAELERRGSPALSAWKAIVGMAYFGRPIVSRRLGVTRLAQVVPFPPRGAWKEVAS